MPAVHPTGMAGPNGAHGGPAEPASHVDDWHALPGSLRQILKKPEDVELVAHFSIGTD